MKQKDNSATTNSKENVKLDAKRHRTMVERVDSTGEKVIAYIVGVGDLPTKQEVIEHCQKYLAHYKVPSQIEFVAEIPKTTVGKVLRHKLRKAA